MMDVDGLNDDDDEFDELVERILIDEQPRVDSGVRALLDEGTWSDLYFGGRLRINLIAKRHRTRWVEARSLAANGDYGAMVSRLGRTDPQKTENALRHIIALELATLRSESGGDWRDERGITEEAFEQVAARPIRRPGRLSRHPASFGWTPR